MTSLARRGVARGPAWHPAASLLAVAIVLLLWADAALAHSVTLGDQGYIREITGMHVIPFLYLGAKHMVTGYDHILFLLGVIFFLYGMKEIGVYVTLFAVGHSTTMLAGVWFDFGIDRSRHRRHHRVLGGLQGARQPRRLPERGSASSRTRRAATLIFGFLHGFGLASKIIDYDISPDGLLANLVAFNLGVEIGQLTALAAILAVMTRWRATPFFARQAYAANVLMMTAGFALMGFQIAGHLVA